MTDRVTEPGRAGVRVLRFLAGGEARLRPAAAPGLWLLERGGKGTMALDAALLAALRERWRGCLCLPCLAALAAGAPLDPPPMPLDAAGASAMPPVPWHHRRSVDPRRPR